MFGSRSRHTHYQQPSRSYFGIILLLAELSRSSHLPPITLAVIILNVLIYFNVFPLFGFSGDLQSVCVSTHAVLDQGDYMRILIAPLFHGDDMHLYYNMASFLYKGQQLEILFGSPYFALLLTILTVSSSLMLVLLGQLASSIFDNPEYLFTCAVGFSAVIFALKVITTHYTPDYNSSSFLGGFIPISSKYIVWVELIIIQLITPNVSFLGKVNKYLFFKQNSVFYLGHLAGILIGLLYVNGPLRYVCNNIYNLMF
jgi:rhomboid domain-containing protein 1